MPKIETPPLTHRFHNFHYNEAYAFASGLAVNPIHLPNVLTDMESDGWQVLSVFGGPGAENLRFLFRRV